MGGSPRVGGDTEPDAGSESDDDAPLRIGSARPSESLQRIKVEPTISGPPPHPNTHTHTSLLHFFKKFGYASNQFLGTPSIFANCNEASKYFLRACI